MIFQKQKLSNLLSKMQTNDPTIKHTIKAYERHGLISYTKGTKVPIENAYEIYKRRFEHLREIKNETIDGFNILLKNFELYKGKFVRIHSFGVSEETYVLFTDNKIQKLIGVLVIKEVHRSDN